MIAELARKADANVWVIKGQERVDASSIIDILTLGCLKGTEITLQIDHVSDINILKKIIEMFEKGFGE